MKCGNFIPTLTVAVPTAYEALRGEGRLRPETRDRVLAAAAKIGYRPNRAAQNMRRGRHRTVGLLLHTWTEFPMRILFFLLDVAHRNDLFLLTEYYSKDMGIPRLLREDCIDGLIVFEGFPPEIESAINEASLPVTRINTYDRTSLGALTYDEATGADLAAAKFAERGRKRPALVLGRQPENKTPHYSYTERIVYFNEACERQGLATPKLIHVTGYGPDTIDAYQKWINPQKDVDCVLLYADAFAVWFYEAMRLIGLKIPKDLSVIGYNNTLKAVERIPQLTSIAVPTDLIAQEAFATIERKLSSGEMPPPKKLPYHLFERASV